MKLGEIYKPREGHGYYMIMEIKLTRVVMSPMFYNEKINYIVYKKKNFKMFFREKCVTKALHPLVQARYDYQHMRRLNVINKTRNN